MNATLTVTDARRQFFDLVEKVNLGSYFTLTTNGSPKAVLLSSDEFEAWQETLDVLHDVPDLENDIKKVRKDMQSGKHLQYKKFNSLTSRRTNVQISNQHNTKSRKRISQAA